jgi:hypothetical protein
LNPIEVLPCISNLVHSSYLAETRDENTIVMRSRTVGKNMAEHWTGEEEERGNFEKFDAEGRTRNPKSVVVPGRVVHTYNLVTQQ